MKKKEIEKNFTKLISLYDVCDELENNGDEVSSKKMRKTLNDLSKFIVSLINEKK